MLKFFVVFAILLVLLALPSLAWADNHGSSQGGGAAGPDCPPDAVICNPLPFETIPQVIDRIIGFLLTLAGPIAVIMLVYAGYLFVVFGTQPDQIKKAKQIILYAVVGIAVLVFSKAIVYVTLNILCENCINPP